MQGASDAVRGLRVTSSLMEQTLGQKHPLTTKYARVLAHLDGGGHVGAGVSSAAHHADVVDLRKPLHLHLKRGDGSVLELDMAPRQTVADLKAAVSKRTR